MIASDKDFDAALREAVVLWRGVRRLYSVAGPDQVSATRLVVAGRKMVAALTVRIGEIEEYSGAAEIRRMLAELQAVGRARSKQ